MMPELARLLARSESSRDVLDCRLLLASKFLSAGKPLAVRIRSKTGGPGECAPNRGSHGQTVRVGRSALKLLMDWLINCTTISYRIRPMVTSQE